MSAHFHKLHCGPRALMMIAERKCSPIDPDELWLRFGADIDAKGGAVAISTILDMARHFGVSRKLDVTVDILRAGPALQHKNVAGVLVACERWVGEDGSVTPEHHLMVLSQASLDTDQSGRAVSGHISVESASAGEPSVSVQIPLHIFSQMLASFYILYD